MPNVLVDGKNCFYQDIGKGYPVLLGHSYLWSSNMWEFQIKNLVAKGFRCIVPDLWDHGKSGHVDAKNITMGQLADNAWNLMEQLAIPDFAVVGLSVGGMWGAELAFKYSNAVKALVLMNTFIGSEPEGTKQKYFALLDILEQEKRFSVPLLNQIVPLFFSPQTLHLKPELVANFRNTLAATKEENISGIVALGRAIFSRSCSLDKLKGLRLPTLFLVGEEDIPRPPRESRQMASLLPHSELHVIEHAGHISCLEQPERVNTLLVNFFEKTFKK